MNATVRVDLVFVGQLASLLVCCVPSSGEES